MKSYKIIVSIHFIIKELLSISRKIKRNDCNHKFTYRI